jgi:hypothetical protein
VNIETETVEAGTFALDADSRTLRGILLPWSETSRPSASNTAPIAFERGSVPVPDPSIVTLNTDHDRFAPVGRATVLENRPEGIYAEFAIANTPEGDAYLADPSSRRKLSAELAGIVRDAADRAKGVAARLTGAALVTEGAFASAALFAIGTETVAPADAPADQPATDPLAPDADGALAVVVTETPVVVLVSAPDTETRFTPEVDATTEQKDNTMTASVPNTATATEAVTPEAVTANEVFSAIANLRLGDATAETMLAALTDIKTTGAGMLPVGGTAIQPTWLGEVYAQKAYVTRYKNLIRQGDIVAFDEKGFTVAAGSEPIQAYAGNKADIPTVSGTTLPVASVFQRWAVGNDIAREFYDIPAGRAVIEAYIRLLVNSYERVTDKWTLLQLKTAAGTALVYDATGVPSGYNAALAKVIQAIDLVDATDAEPTSVIVAADVWKALRYTAKDQIPEYVNFALNRTDGTADNGVVVLKDKTGTLATGQVLGISRESAHVNELAGATPMQIDALDIARGGIDKAFHGYTQFMAENPAGLILLGN